MRGAFESGGLVLCFHRVRDTPFRGFRPTADLGITAEFLDNLIRYILRRGIAIVSLSEAVARLRQGMLRDPFVSFTFDDGYQDNFDTALPIFEKHKVPFAVFLTTGFLDGTAGMWWVVAEATIGAVDRFQLPNGRVLSTRTIREKNDAFNAAAAWFRYAHPEASSVALKQLVQQAAMTEYRFEERGEALSWDMVRRMVRTDLVSIGAHTVTHPMISGLGKAAIVQEVTRSRDRIAEEIGACPRFFAYPYGMPADIGGIAEKIVANCGFDAAFTTVGRLLAADDARRPFALPRVSWSGYEQCLGILDAHVSGIWERVRGLRRLSS